jgi:D-Tyr-tRNAtyr deacylase
MRLCIQRVKSASVTVDGEVTGRIDKGLMVLIGLGDVDGEEGSPPADELVKWACDKILGIKFWENEAGKPWKMSADALKVRVCHCALLGARIFFAYVHLSLTRTKL